MIIQIENSKILNNLDELGNIEDPKHGDCFYIKSEVDAYSFYDSKKSVNNGEWKLDKHAILYIKYYNLKEGYTDVTDYYPNIIRTPIEEIKDAYNKYKSDGVEYNDNFRAEMVLKYKLGELTESAIFEIESKLKLVRNLVKSGDWMTANYELSLITISGSYTQEMHDGINNYITNYISENY